MYISGVSIYMGPTWLPYYFCSLSICIYRVSQYTRDPCDCPIISAHSVYVCMGCLNIHGTHVTAQLFLPTQYMYISGVLIYMGHMWLPNYFCSLSICIYRVSQYTRDPCDCPIISAHSVYVYIRCFNIHGTHVTAQLFLLTLYMYISGVSIYTGPMWLPSYSCSLSICIFQVSQYTWDTCDCPVIPAHSVYVYFRCLNIHGTHVTAQLFLLTQYMYISGVSIYTGPMWLPSYSCSLSICIFQVSQYTRDTCDCPVIPAHSVYVYFRCLNIHGTHVTAQLFLLTQYMYIFSGVSIYTGHMWLPSYSCSLSICIFQVSQYTWDTCDCPVIPAHSVYVYFRCLNIHGTHVTAQLFLLTQYMYISGVSIYTGPMWLPQLFLLTQYMYISGCLNIHGTHVTAQLFLLTQYMYISGVSIYTGHMWLPSYSCSLSICIFQVSQYTRDTCDCPVIPAHSVYVYFRCLNIHGTHVTAQLFLLTQYMYISGVSIYTGTHVTAQLFLLTQYMYISGVSIYTGHMWLPSYSCSLSICIYQVSQYTRDPCDCPVMPAHSVYVYFRCLSIHGIHVTAQLFLLTLYMYISGVSIYIGHMWMLITLL